MKTITIKTEPISVNKLYYGRKVLSKTGRDIKKAISWEVKSQWKKEPIEEEVSLNVLFYSKNRKSLDIDNGLKGLMDCLTGIVWRDDRQVVELHCYKEVDKNNPRIELQVF